MQFRSDSALFSSSGSASDSYHSLNSSSLSREKNSEQSNNNLPPMRNRKFRRKIFVRNSCQLMIEWIIFPVFMLPFRCWYYFYITVPFSAMVTIWAYVLIVVKVLCRRNITFRSFCKHVSALLIIVDNTKQKIQKAKSSEIFSFLVRAVFEVRVVNLFLILVLCLIRNLLLFFLCFCGFVIF